MTTANLQVGASLDDAYQGGSGTMYTTSDENGTTSANRYWGWRWVNVPPAQAATINSATLQIYAQYSATDDIHLTITGDDVDNAAAFSTTAYDISGRVDTAASVNEDHNDVGVGFHAIPVTAIVQEIVDRALWAANNALVMTAITTTGINLTLPQWNGYPAQASKLDVDYTNPTVGGQPMQLRGWAVPGMRRWRAGRIN